MSALHLLQLLMFGLFLLILNRVYFPNVSAVEFCLIKSSLKSPLHTGHSRCKSPSFTFTSMLRCTQFLHTILHKRARHGKWKAIKM